MITARYFGRKAFGSIRGTEMMLGLPAAVAAPIFAGSVYDTFGNYEVVFQSCVFFLSLCVITTILAMPPKAPAKVVGINQIV